MVDLIETFLLKNNYTNFSKEDISLQLQTHPDYPSFKSISDTLDYFGIENIVAKVPEDSLSILPNNFLTLINTEGRKLVLISKKGDWIYIYEGGGNKQKYSTENFLKIWDKTIIAVEGTKKQKEKFVSNYFLYALPFVFFVSLLILNQTPLLYLLYCIISLLGLYISYLLLKEKMGYHSTSILNICTATKNSSCNDVINSIGANIYKDFNLADASFLFFAILIFAQVFYLQNPIIPIFTIAALPVVLYSFYYQAIVIKKACPLCLSVATILIILNAIVLFGMDFRKITILNTIEFFTLSSFVALLFFFAKKLIIKDKKNKEELVASRKFKRNPQLLEVFLDKGGIIMDTDLWDKEIIIGNLSGNYQIIAYTNPLCGFCKVAFQSYLKIIKINQDIKIALRFNTDPTNINHPSTKISTRLIEIYLEKQQQVFIEAFSYWFENRNESSWLKLYGEASFKPSTLEILKNHKEWGAENKINYTPATIMKNQIFPTEYGYVDLPQIINDIILFQAEKNSELSIA